jgi:hypothetical protein
MKKNNTYLLLAAVAVAVWYFFFRKQNGGGGGGGSGSPAPLAVPGLMNLKQPTAAPAGGTSTTISVGGAPKLNSKDYIGQIAAAAGNVFKPILENIFSKASTAVATVAPKVNGVDAELMDLNRYVGQGVTGNAWVDSATFPTTGNQSLADYYYDYWYGDGY